MTARASVVVEHDDAVFSAASFSSAIIRDVFFWDPSLCGASVNLFFNKPWRSDVCWFLLARAWFLLARQLRAAGAACREVVGGSHLA